MIVHITINLLAAADEVELWIAEGIALFCAGVYVWYFIEKFGVDIFKAVIVLITAKIPNGKNAGNWTGNVRLNKKSGCCVNINLKQLSASIPTISFR